MAENSIFIAVRYHTTKLNHLKGYVVIYFYRVFMSSYFTWLANDKHHRYWCSTRCSGTERLELHLISIDYNMTRDQNSIFRVGRVQWLDLEYGRRT